MKKNVIVKKGFWILGLLLMLAVSVAAYGFSQAGERADCPGTVECPLTGEEVCKDRCPLVDANRVDCPLTGEKVCRDECPLDAGAQTSKAEEELPACCREK